MKRLSLIVFLVCLMTCSVANADTVTWNGAVGNGLWSDANNWSDGTTQPPAVWPPALATESYYIKDGGAATVDKSWTGGLLCISRGATPSTVNVNNSDVTLTMSKASTELVSVCYDACSVGTLNISAGTVKVFNPSAATGELRMSHVYNQYNRSTINLSDTGTLDVQVLNRGDKAASNANFNATGGTLVVRTSIIKWGLVTAGYPGFHQGGCLLKPGGSIGSMLTGNSTNEMDYFMDPTSKVEFELGDGDPNALLSVNDLITSWGNFTIDGELKVSFTGAHDIGDKWNAWKIESTKVASYSGSGAFDIIPANIQVNWLNTGSGTDILQLEYVPEPATIALLGLGLLLVRRTKK